VEHTVSRCFEENVDMKKEYKKPEFETHEPLKVVSGSAAADDDTGTTSYWY